MAEQKNVGKIAFLLTLLTLFGPCVVWGQQFSKMPEPLPQVGYVGELPSWKIEIYRSDGYTVSKSPQTSITTGTAPHGKMIILQQNEQLDKNQDAVIVPEPPEWFYLSRSIWKDCERILGQFYNPPPVPYIFGLARDVSRRNGIKVPAWKLDGKILDTKMPLNFKLWIPSDYRYLWLTQDKQFQEKK